MRLNFIASLRELRVEQPTDGRVKVFMGEECIASFDLPPGTDDEQDIVNLFINVDKVLVHDEATHEALNR